MRCVYKILNNITGQIYIGSTICFDKRKASHLSFLKRNKHPNNKLQNSYNKYGVKAFSFSVIQECEQDELVKVEQKWLTEHWSESIFNVFKTAYAVYGQNHPMFGKNHSDETKKKIKHARSSQVISHSPETRKKIGRPGKKVSKEHINKMIAARNGKAWNKGIKMKAPVTKIILPFNEVENLIFRYQGGESIESIRKKYKYSWDTIKRILVESGITTRNISQQKRIYDTISTND